MRKPRYIYSITFIVMFSVALLATASFLSQAAPTAKSSDRITSTCSESFVRWVSGGEGWAVTGGGVVGHAGDSLTVLHSGVNSGDIWIKCFEEDEVTEHHFQYVCDNEFVNMKVMASLRCNGDDCDIALGFGHRSDGNTMTVSDAIGDMVIVTVKDANDYKSVTMYLHNYELQKDHWYATLASRENAGSASSNIGPLPDPAVPVQVLPIAEGGTLRNNGTSPFAGMLGYSFESSSPLIVNYLGVWDGPTETEDKGLGLEQSSEVGIWDADTEVLLGSTTVGSGTAGILVDEFRYNEIDVGAIELEVGVEYVVGALYTFNGNAFLRAANAFPPNDDITGVLSLFDSGGFGIPTTPSPQVLPFLYGGPNVTFIGSNNLTMVKGSFWHIESIRCIN